MTAMPESLEKKRTQQRFRWPWEEGVDDEITTPPYIPPKVPSGKTTPDSGIGGVYQGFFSLGGPVGRSAPNDRQDVIKVETVLANSGYGDWSQTQGPTGYYGTVLEDGIKKFQGDHGLEQDGHLDPQGPTLRTLKSKVGGLLADYLPPTPDQVEEHHQRLVRGDAPQALK